MPLDEHRLIGFETGTVRPPGPDTAAPTFWLALSIASTVCFCLPFGLVGAIYSGLALSDREQRRWDAMDWHVRVARRWTVAAFAVGCGVFVATAWWTARGNPP